MTIAAAVEAIADALETVVGLAEVFHEAPDSMSEFPCALVYAKNGQLGQSQAGGKVYCDIRTHVVVVEIHQQGQSTPEAIALAHTWPEPVYNAIRTATMPAGMIIQYPITWELGSLDYNRQQHTGVYFEVPIKE